VRLRESIEIARPPDDAYAALAEPERRGDGPAWREIGRDDGAYRAKLHLSGSIDLDFDCRFELDRQPPHAVMVRGVGTSSRLGFTFEGSLSVRGSGATSTVDADIEVLPAGPLAGLGQRRVREQARRLIAEFVALDRD
jgi:carbon monoxide dehydrogenase subunit G